MLAEKNERDQPAAAAVVAMVKEGLTPTTVTFNLYVNEERMSHFSRPARTSSATCARDESSEEKRRERPGERRVAPFIPLLLPSFVPPRVYI